MEELHVRVCMVGFDMDNLSYIVSVCISRQVDDLNFRLEELSVISGDQLEKVAMKDDGELDELKKRLVSGAGQVCSFGQ